MTTEEKLQYFFDASVESAAAEAEQMKKEHQDALDRIFQEHRLTRKRQADIQLQTESDRLKREINKTVSAKQLEYRQILSSHTEEIRKKVFAEVEKKLAAFKTTPEYVDFLCSKIKDAQNFAGEDEIHIYIDPSDEALLPSIQEKIGFTPMISNEPWMGGIRAVIHSKNILIDHSFASALKDAKEEFVFTGGAHHE